MVSENKKLKVEQLKKMVSEYPIIGVVNMQSLPAPQLQTMRNTLRGKVELRMARIRMLKRVIEGTKAEKLSDYLVGMPALLFTKENPFGLFKTVAKSKSKAPAKPGQVAPTDIKIQAGPTPFAPGPVISELGSIGLKTGVESGKVTIREDAIVCKKGEPIKPKVADVLKRLGIEPMEIGLNIVAVIEQGVVFQAEQLSIDEEAFSAKLTEAIMSARNLAVEAGYPAKDIIEIIIQKVAREARGLALEAGILSKDTIEDLIGITEAGALAVQSLLGKD